MIDKVNVGTKFIYFKILSFVGNHVLSYRVWKVFDRVDFEVSSQWLGISLFVALDINNLKLQCESLFNWQNLVRYLG